MCYIDDKLVLQNDCTVPHTTDVRIILRIYYLCFINILNLNYVISIGNHAYLSAIKE